MNNKEYYNQYRHYHIGLLRHLLSSDTPEDVKHPAKLVYQDTVGLVEFQGVIITTIKRNRIAHCLD